MTDDPNEPSGIVPPYEGRRETADTGGTDEAYRDGANVGGATGPVQNPDAAASAGGGTGSPADEQPAAQTTESRGDDTGTGPAHEPGTPRGEDRA